MLNQIKKLKKAVSYYKESNGFISSDLNCCPNCNGDIETEHTDYIEYTLCACTYYCPRCQRIVGSWAYGTFNPYDIYSKVNPKKREKIFDQMYKNAESGKEPKKKKKKGSTISVGVLFE